MVLVIFACQNKTKKATNKEEVNHEKKHWGYKGETSPEHWAEIDENTDCSGYNQSPINIITSKTVRNTTDSIKIDILYSPETELSRVTNNGHSIEFDFERGDSLRYLGHTYHLKQIHFHGPSEHTIDSLDFPIEMHLVHMNSNNEYTVVSILGKEGEESDYSEFFSLFLPLKVNETKEIHEPLDLADLFPENLDYYSYKGSLTTPPCTETVNWVILKDPITISKKASTFLKRNMPINNYRNEQPVNRRIVYSVSINK